MPTIIELNNTFQRGFRLSEKDLRRIIDTVRDKLSHANMPALNITYHYKLANGALLTTQSLDELLNEENIASKRIIHLLVEFGDRATGEYGNIQFSDVIRQKDEAIPVSYKLVGTDRDSLFVLAAELDERLNQITHLRLWPKDLPRAFILTFALFMSVATLFLFSILKPKFDEVQSSVSGIIDNRSTYSQDINCLFSFLVDIEKARSQRKTSCLDVTSYVSNVAC
jgi:hypothetical protein